MRRSNKKTWFIIFTYSLCLTFALLFTFYIFLNSTKKEVTGVPSLLYYETLNPSAKSSAKNEYNLSVDAVVSSQTSTIKNYIPSSTLSDMYKDLFFEYLPLLIVGICTCVMLSSMMLWLFLQKSEQQKQKKIIGDFRSLAQAQRNGEFETEFTSEFEEIKEILKSYEQDQEKLHSYIAHEQKNLIMLMKSRVATTDVSKLEGDIDKLSKSVDDILTISTHHIQEREVVDVALTCAQICDMYRNIYPSLTFAFDEEKEYTIMGREQLLKRCLHNLIDNAIKYGNQQPIAIDIRQDRGSVQIIIMDYGIGMDEKKLEEIFAYRYQIHDLKRDGYGIGLSLVKHVCDLFDGVIWVESQLGVGSTFKLSFPLFTQP